MSIIKKKPGWRRYAKPIAPYAPIKPKKENIRNKFVSFASQSVIDGDTIRLSDFAIPEGIDWRDIIINISQDCDRYRYSYNPNAWAAKIDIGSFNNEVLINHQYKQELEHYNQQYKEYKKKKVKYKEEVKAWESWKLQDEKEQLEKRLKKAKDLLKKHNRLEE